MAPTVEQRNEDGASTPTPRTARLRSPRHQTGGNSITELLTASSASVPDEHTAPIILLTS
jgi:hypothetical protein